MQARSHDIVIRQTAVFDGHGNPPFIADVAIDDDRIAHVGQIPDRGGIEIDGRGLAVAPGFIDVHSHDDLAVLVAPQMDFKVMQGVTTEVVGNCGLGAAPYTVAIRTFAGLHAGIQLPPWEGYAGYFEAVDRDPPSLNIAVLAGHGTIREDGQ